MSAAVTLPTDLAPWEGWCLELVDSLLHQHPTGDILYVEPNPRTRLGRRWKYHAAMVLDGVVYDAWHPEVRLPPAEYVAKVFGEWATWELNPGADDDE